MIKIGLGGEGNRIKRDGEKVARTGKLVEERRKGSGGGGEEMVGGRVRRGKAECAWGEEEEEEKSSLPGKKMVSLLNNMI